MLNIISLSATRDKITWPWKVIKNLMKWLDLIWYPYVLNHDLNSTKRLLIHDDIYTINKINNINKNTKILLGPNLYNMPRNLPKNLNLDKFVYIFPSNWILNMWKYFWYKWKTVTWPVWIDTNKFTPSKEKKEIVLIYFKTRFPKELKLCEELLYEKNIKYNIINYDLWYKEENFINLLKKTKYVIWIWRQETQWIALQEILSMNIPILIWDIHRVWDWNPIEINQIKSLNDDELNYSKWVTSAEYFNESCWIKIKNWHNLNTWIDLMNKKLNNFTPRKFILENLSLEKQAKNFIYLYEKEFWLSYNSWFKEKLLNNKIYRNNFYYKLLFKIYDLKIISLLIKLKNKILW